MPKHIRPNPASKMQKRGCLISLAIKKAPNFLWFFLHLEHLKYPVIRHEQCHIQLLTDLAQAAKENTAFYETKKRKPTSETSSFP